MLKAVSNQHVRRSYARPQAFTYVRIHLQAQTPDTGRRQMVAYKCNNKCINKNNRASRCSRVPASVRQMCGAARCPKSTRRRKDVHRCVASARTTGNLSKKKGGKKEADKRRECGPWLYLYVTSLFTSSTLKPELCRPVRCTRGRHHRCHPRMAQQLGCG